MLVTYVLGDCPGCGGKGKFGNVSVRGDHVLRGCKGCRHSVTVWLPETRKKILYLDQFFFSSAFREHDERFVRAAQLISQISELQLLAIPFSSVHEDETHQWRGYDGRSKDDLMEFIKTTSRGHEFEPAYEVEESQIVQSFQAFNRGEAEAFDVQEEDAIRGNIHEWDDYIRIDVGRYFGDIELLRGLKLQSVEGLVDLFPKWRASSDTFEENLKVEYQGAVSAFIGSYLAYATRVAKGDVSALFDSPIISSVVQSLMYCLPKDMNPDAKMEKISEYFCSSHFLEVPSQWISVRAFSVLKDMVKRGAYADRENAIKRLSGFFQDVKHISVYAPYCDAFVMDQPMAALMSDPRIALEARYGVKIFSLNNWDAFLAWLSQLKESMTQEHRAGLAAAYPYLNEYQP